MNISAVTSIPVQQAILPQNRTEGRVEGTKPDGDGDQDDAVQGNAAQQTNNSSQVASSLGSKIDLTS